MSAAVKALIALVLLTSAAFGRGGYVTTWDPNLFGGGWVCFEAAVTGCSQGFNATCNGVADDTSALTSFRTFAAANANVKLYIPPGANCTITYDGTFTFTSGAHNLIVWAYGARFNNLALGALQAFFQDSVHQALIADASAGATTVTVTDGNIARMTVGHWVLIGGLSIQSFGYPPNFQFFEYHVITSIVGNVVTLDSPLLNSYKSTWPSVPVPNIAAGPATIYDLDQTWNTNVQWYGGTVSRSTVAQINVIGRDVALYDVNWQSALQNNPSASNNSWCFNCVFGGGMEIDKDSSNLYFWRGALGPVTSTSPNRSITYDGSTSTGSFNGTGRFVTFTGGTKFIGGGAIGNGIGHSETLTLNGSNLGTIQCTTNAVPVGWLTYNGTGTFSIANADPNWGTFVQWPVVGYTYFFATVNPIVNLGQAFTITGMRQDATNTYVDTDIPGALPSLGQTNYVAQPAPTVTVGSMTGSSTPINATGAWCHL